MKRVLEWLVDWVFLCPPGWREPIQPLSFDRFDDALADWDRRFAEFIRGRS